MRIVHQIIRETDLMLQHTILFASNTFMLRAFVVKWHCEHLTLMHSSTLELDEPVFSECTPCGEVSVLPLTKFSSLSGYFSIFVWYFSYELPDFCDTLYVHCPFSLKIRTSGQVNWKKKVINPKFFILVSKLYFVPSPPFLSASCNQILKPKHPQIWTFVAIRFPQGLKNVKNANSTGFHDINSH